MEFAAMGYMQGFELWLILLRVVSVALLIVSQRFTPEIFGTVCVILVILNYTYALMVVNLRNRIMPGLYANAGHMPLVG